MDDSKSRQKGREDAAGAAGTYKAGVPVKGDSSSSGVTPPENTFFDDSPLGNSDSQIPQDAGATIADAGAISGTKRPSRASGGRPPERFIKDVRLQAGDVLGERYEILQMLGEGGMGAVYKAADLEVSRHVALKVIRPDLASNPAILARFKQELLTAHQVTHRNVIRIYDLSEADGVKFITMEFIEGSDLRKFCMDRGKLSTHEVVDIIRQVSLALDAAHSVGVIHRDLKPQNIMRDAQGRTLVMDFGLARSMGKDGMTQTGALLGTMEYMSPEQAMGKNLDQRSDLFTLGLIFYELLTGKMPYSADSAMASLLLRNQQRAIPASQLDTTIPKGLCDIVSKCLERDLTMRYQSAREILADLDAWEGKRPTSASRVSAMPSVAAPVAEPAPSAVTTVAGGREVPWKWIAIGVMVAMVGAGGWMFRGKVNSKPSGPVAGGPEVSLAILPFHNTTGELSSDWIGSSLADMLSTDVGQSAHMRIVSSDRLHQILKDLRLSGNADLDADSLRRIADITHADTVVWGKYAKTNGEIHIDARLEDLKRQRTIPLKVDAASESALVNTVNKLAGSIQENLSLSSGAQKELKAVAFTPTSESVEALKNFSLGLERAREGNHIEAVKEFEAATKVDPQFALAYSMLGKTYSRLGYQKQAEESAGKSMEFSSNLPPAEKYMIQAANARIGNNYQNALDAYNNLAGIMPNDVQVQFELGELYEAHGEYDKAHERYANVLAGDPKHIDALRSMGQVEYERGNPQGSLDYLNRALSLAVELNNRQGKSIVLHDLGEAYRLLNRPQDALQNFQQSLEIKKEIGDKQGMAASLDEIGLTYGLLGKTAEADKTFRQELAIRKDIGDQAGLGLALLNYGAFLQDSGKYEDALTATKQALQIELQVGYEPRQALCLTNVGLIYMQMAKYDDALTYQQRAVDLLQKLKMPGELAASLNNVGTTYSKIGQFDKALNSFVMALEQARKVRDKLQLAATSDNMADLFVIQGRLGAALNAQQDALKSGQQLEQGSGAFIAEIQADYANILNRLGRGQEARQILEESLKTARSGQNEALAAKILNFQGQTSYYSGDFKAARPLFEQARQSAAKAKDRIQTLSVGINLSRLAVKEGHAGAALPALKNSCKEADSLGVKFIAADCSMTLGEGLLETKDYAGAQSELQAVIRKSDEAGMKSLLPEAHYLLSQALRKTGNNSEADRHSQLASQLVKQMRDESGSEALLNRVDLKPIATQGAK